MIDFHSRVFCSLKKKKVVWQPRCWQTKDAFRYRTSIFVNLDPHFYSQCQRLLLGQLFWCENNCRTAYFISVDSNVMSEWCLNPLATAKCLWKFFCEYNNVNPDATVCIWRLLWMAAGTGRLFFQFRIWNHSSSRAVYVTCLFETKYFEFRTLLMYTTWLDYFYIF